MFLNAMTFEQKIEELVRGGNTYIEAILEFCEEYDVDYEDVKKLMTTNLIGKVKLCAMDNGYIKREGTIPVELME